MANVLVEEQYLQNIANAIREKNGLFDKYTPAQMEQAILDIPIGGGGETILPEKVQDVLFFPNSPMSVRMIYEKTLSRYKTLDVR